MQGGRRAVFVAYLGVGAVQSPQEVSAAILRTVTIARASHDYPPGYWDALVGHPERMPAVIDGGQLLVGYLVGAEEGESEITLTFADLQPE